MTAVAARRPVPNTDAPMARAAEGADRRGAVLRLLQGSDRPLTIAAIAAALGVHPNTVRFHLDALVDGDRVERAPSGPIDGPGRPAALFRPVRAMDPNGRREYRLLAEILLDGMGSGPEPTVDAALAGRRWGRSLADRSAPDRTAAGRPAAARAGSTKASVGRLVNLLDGLGFAPERRTSGGIDGIGLRNCPFLELARTRSEVICPVHLGIMQGALEAWDAPVSVDRLDPFVEPDLCLAHLSLGASTGNRP